MTDFFRRTPSGKFIKLYQAGQCNILLSFENQLGMTMRKPFLPTL